MARLLRAAAAFRPAGSKLGRMAFSTSPKTVKVTFVNVEGTRVTVDGAVGDTVLQVARQNNIDIYGPCEGGGWDANDYGSGPSCSECRCKIPIEYVDKAGTISKEEAYVLSQCSDTTELSRLSCQIRLNEDLDELLVAIPEWDTQSWWETTN
mmetsp:Transcript_16123/g.28997  ORF Transcript_16123/g.28997 Transcript_16123/m.28997 type:complete len:152 (+) Transcript_16123:26-481(+)|eukprot:CAMPEP_0197525576 /NCGR_PEP_ID=MMETSP1318-20131121/12907_1 /TAXON_ID=552666 /ORGANISM="Partenskyella glossopodia, Strain RCC365" /LENGTH=151 /DNA_ID=CAMNT_0043079113 /DNA_START=23 /DNA_END=478 /DNA_ORIENTATION=+